jgi:MFS family permease
VQQAKALRTLVLANFFMAFGFNIWQAVFNNFAVEELGISPAQMGLLQSLREIPGALGFLTGFIALAFTELSIASASVALMGLGLALMSLAKDWLTLVLYTMAFSIGFHLFYPAGQAAALLLAEKRAPSRLLGHLSSIGAAAALLATLAIVLLVNRVGIRAIMAISGVITALGGLACARRTAHTSRQSRPAPARWHKRYWLYYILTFLMGSRRHIFSTFAIFLLVHDHGLHASGTAALFLVANLLSTYLARAIGRLIASAGEKKALTGYFLAIAAICLGYAGVQSFPLLACLFVADGVLSRFDMALDSYMRKIAPEEEVTANTSLSQTINHLAALVVPAAGGLLWEQLGSAAPFVFGAAVAATCAALAQRIHLAGQEQEAAGLQQL